MKATGARARLRDVVEDLVVEGRRGRRAAERQQHLLAAGADRHEVDRLLVDDIALGQRLAGREAGQGRRGVAAGQRRRCGEQATACATSTGETGLEFQARATTTPSNAGITGSALARSGKTGKPASAPMQQRPRADAIRRETASMFQRLFGRERDAQPRDRGRALRAQSWRRRGSRAFYSHWQVPDTPLGRFEMLSLHMFLFQHRHARRGRRGARARPGY